MSIEPNTDQFAEKWGEAAKAGFLMVPDVLLKNQAALGLNPTEMVVVLNICMHWWYAERLPFPRTSTIARRMKMERRTIQRALRSLQDRGLILKVPPGASRDVQAPADWGGWDLSGLVARLEGLAKSDPSYLRRTVQVSDSGVGKNQARPAVG